MADANKGFRRRPDLPSNPDDWANGADVISASSKQQPMPKLVKQQPSVKAKPIPELIVEQGRATKEETVGYNVPIPKSLYNRLKYYVDNHARRHESMAHIIRSGLEAELDRLEKGIR